MSSSYLSVTGPASNGYEKPYNDCQQGNDQTPQGGGEYPPRAAGYGGPIDSLGYPPVVNQPIGHGSPGSSPAKSPLGLESLTTIDQLLIHPKVELQAAPNGFEPKNKFTIKNQMGEKVFHAVETSDGVMRNCCGSIRPLEIIVMGNNGNQRMEVFSPLGTNLGIVEQEWSIFRPSFAIKNTKGETVFRIEGPCCTCGDIEFKVTSSDGSQVGRISKQSFMPELFPDTDYFGINFPMDLDVRMKAVMLGASFLIDAMFFKTGENQCCLSMVLSCLNHYG